MFFFFSNRLGCLGSLLLSAAVTAALMLLLFLLHWAAIFASTRSPRSWEVPDDPADVLFDFVMMLFRSMTGQIFDEVFEVARKITRVPLESDITIGIRNCREPAAVTFVVIRRDCGPDQIGNFDQRFSSSNRREALSFRVSAANFVPCARRQSDDPRNRFDKYLVQWGSL
jgi:hypothetical protein